MATWNPIKLTAMHHRHIALGATMRDYRGWQRPSSYTSPEQELEAVHKAGGFSDISPLGKLYIQGRDVISLIRALLPEARSLQINKATVTTLAGPEGSTADRVVVSRFCDDEVFITCSPEKIIPVAQALKEHLNGCAHLVDMTSNFAAVNIVGPLSGHLLSKLTELDISSKTFQDLSCAQGMVAEVYAIVRRWDQGGLPSYDVYFGRDFGEYMWEAMIEAGHEFGIAPVGVESLKHLARGG